MGVDDQVQAVCGDTDAGQSVDGPAGVAAVPGVEQHPFALVGHDQVALGYPTRRKCSQVGASPEVLMVGLGPEEGPPPSDPG
jgi:hypothetical protein